ncbi:MAG TPA: cytochrome c3 family protein [Acidobacteriota bacterium]|nr:cytochrome c3 family protein [Acidobacteriota bacterium]
MKTWFKRSLLTLGITTVAVLILFVATVSYTNRSNFCTTCHYMQPFYDAWAASSHSEVPCRDCHYEPGYSNVVKGKLRDLNQLVKYWTNAYRRSKPWAEIADASCLRAGCHETRLLQGQVDFQNVNFNHRPHLLEMRRGKKLRCTSCHSQIVQGEHMTVTESTCITCHFKLNEKGENFAACTICHDPPIPVAGQDPPKYDHTDVVARELSCIRCHGTMVVGDGAVPRERCYACHWDRERLDQYGNTDIMHARHITESKIECDLCHLSMQHKSTAKEQAMPECQACHTDLHRVQQRLFTGHGGFGVGDTPNPMYQRGLTCQSCHVVHEDAPTDAFTGETFVATGESCEPCHGEGYNRLLANWKKSAGQKLETIDRLLSDARKVRRNTGADPAVLDSLYREAEYNYEMVHLGRPIHNIVFANALLGSAYDRLQEFFVLADPGYQVVSLPANGTVVPSDCANCHSGIEEIDEPIFGLVYSHKRHLVNAQLTCSRCHSNQTRHGELIVQRKDCLSCHHSQQERQCGYCHTAQEAIVGGRAGDLPLADADVMYASDVTCRDCHEMPDRTIVRPVPQRCVDCHDKSYADVQREWLAEFAGLRHAIDTLSARVADLPVVPERETILEPIRAHVRAIDADGSRGTHNHFEQTRILKEDVERLKGLLRTH